MIEALVLPQLRFLGLTLVACLIPTLLSTLNATPALATPSSRLAPTSQPTAAPALALHPSSRPAPHATSRSTSRPTPTAHRSAPTGDPPGPRSSAQETKAENSLSPALTRRNRHKRPKFTSVSRTAFFWSRLIGMLVALCVIVLLIYVLLRWAASRMGIQTQTNQRMLRVIDRLSLEPKKGLWIVEAAEQYWLLATHEQGVTLLEQLDAAKVRERLTPQETITGGFWERLRRGTPTTNVPADVVDAADDAQTKADPNPKVIPTQFEVISDGKSSAKETP